MLLVIAGLAGGGLGGVAGAYLVAPRLAGGGAAPAAASAAATPAGEAAKPAKAAKAGEKGAEKGGEAARLYRIDNVIVNPAGSDGTRFLMASVAYQIADEASEKLLQAHEIQLRDDVVGALESMSMPRLTQPHARDSIKVQLLIIVHRILGPDAQVDVYMPQFVIQ
jgi:flagellar FliL protein